MKTKNNVQKTILKSLAIVTSLVLISFTVSAQGFWKSLLQNSTFNEIAFAMVHTSNASSNTNVSDTESSAVDNAIYWLLNGDAEENLEIEDWMMDESSFTGTYALAEADDEPLKLKEWMKDESLFGIADVYLVADAENKLEIENWMVNSKAWKN